MTDRIDERIENMLYHALGHDIETGIEAFEARFQIAVAGYHIQDLVKLSNLLRDSTLQQDQEREVWLLYYEARIALAKWQPDQAIAKIDACQILPAHRDTDRIIGKLQPRLWLLRGQAEAMQGKWTEAIKSLDRSKRNVGDDIQLLIDIEIWTARTFIDRALSTGGWREITREGFDKAFYVIASATLWPIFAIVWCLLLIFSMRRFWHVIVRYGNVYSNWPVFTYYLGAYQSIRRAETQLNQLSASSENKVENAAPKVSQNVTEKHFLLKLLHARLMRCILQSEEAIKIYEELLGEQELLEKKRLDAPYQTAIIEYELARVFAEGDEDKTKEALDLLRNVIIVFTEFQDERFLASALILQGRVAARFGSVEEAISSWSKAFDTFQSTKDYVLTSEYLNAIYTFMESNEASVDEADRQKLLDLTDKVQSKVFSLTMPNWMYRWIQLVSFTVPVFSLIGLTLWYANGVILRGSWDALLSSQEAALTAGLFVLFGIPLMNTVLGLFGLAVTWWRKEEAAHLSIYVVDNDGIRLTSFNKTPSRWEKSSNKLSRGLGKHFQILGTKLVTQILWDDVAAYVRVERGLWRKPDRTQSFDYLVAGPFTGMKIPGITSWYKRLQGEIAYKLQKHKQLETQHKRMRPYGVLYFAGIELVYAFSVWIEKDLPFLRLGGSVPFHAWLISLAGGLIIVLLCFWIGTLVLHFQDIHYAFGRYWTFYNVNLLFALLIGLSVLIALIAYQGEMPNLLLISVELLLLVGLILRRYPDIVLGIVLLAIGVLGRDLIYPNNTLVICLGTALLSGFVWSNRRRFRSEKLALVATVFLIAVGSLLTLNASLVVILSGRTLIYRTALGDAKSPPEMQELFGQLQDETWWMRELDPTFSVGYANLGMVLYEQGDYQASLQAFQRANELNPEIDSDFLNCQAFVEYRMGFKQSAFDLVEKFVANDNTYDNNIAKFFEDLKKNPWCETVFLSDYLQYKDYIENKN